TGIKDADRHTVITEFIAKIPKLKPGKTKQALTHTWMEAFRLLREYLLGIKTKKKKIVFLDEFPWMDSHKSGFLAAFEYFWNDWASDQNIIIVICGSSTSWMMKHVMDNKAGLHNRITKYINLAPFTLKETKALLLARGIPLPHYEIVQLYMAIGGVPYYLNEVRKGESAIQNIDRILFSEKSSLKREFQNLYRALFDQYEKYETIVKALSLKRKGLTRQEIIMATSIPNGGSLTRMLTELEESSFIKSYQPFGKEKKETLYRLVDEYSVFYYQFSPQKNNAGSFMKISNSAKYRSWAGFAFESLCMRHSYKIKKALSIAGIFSQESAWYFKGDKQQPGFQIDMLIDRSDNSINICEMKFYATEFELSKKEADELRKRREFFRTKTQTRKYLINTLLTTYGLKSNEHSAGIIDKVVVIDQLF
ncbi:MAG: ATP-binding protein, partial [Gloeobacteraceae cyanobacterium ES-bin-316]|nr:ATP-binding protein [Ferruginibacter sp.]